MSAIHLMDAWDSFESITLWLKLSSGKNLFVQDQYFPKIWIRTFTPRGRGILRNLVEKKVLRTELPSPSSAGILEGEKVGDWVDLWTGRTVSAEIFRVQNIRKMRTLIRDTDFVSEDIEFYGSDISSIQGYFLEKDLYPMAKVEIGEMEEDSSGSRIRIRRLSDRDSFDSEVDLVRLTSITIFSDHGRYIPLGVKNPLRILISPTECVSLEGEISSIFHGLNHILHDLDPDLVFSNGGDEYLLPQIFRYSQESGIPSLLDRDKIPTNRNLEIRSRTFYSYGRVIHKTTAFPLFGRIHLDKRESFFYSESDLDGILEMAKYARLPIQRMARSSPGTAMSAMEDEIALGKRILIPRVKGKASSIKPLSVVLKVDQGGMTYRPTTGYYENVVELDFRSLYPSLMSVYNISGETVNCECCSWDGVGIPVPFTPYHTCSKRRGIVSDTVDILIHRRDRIKEWISDHPFMSQDDLATWDKRSTALKWCLVTCFGYTGYKNAKYGRREAHEAITAWGRYAITQAKEIAESIGYSFLHGLTDSLWLSATRQELLERHSLDELSKKVKDRLSLRLLHEATYSWIVYPSSKVREGFSVPTRYYGRDSSGKMKVRGIALRRKNTPRFVDAFQKDLLDILALCKNRGEIHAKEDEFYRVYKNYKWRLIHKEWTSNELVVRQSITKKSGDFQANSASKIVLDAILEEGIRLEGGQTIEYIVTNRKSSLLSERYKPLYRFDPGKDPIDLSFYNSLLADAWEEILGIFFPARSLFPELNPHLI